MNDFLTLILPFLLFHRVSPKVLTRRENKILKANCGRYVEGFTSLNGNQKTGEEYKSLYGEDVQIGDAPWVVSLAMKKKKLEVQETSEEQFLQYGTGTIISPWHIVTAAHLIGVSEDPGPDCETGDMKNATFLRDFKDFVAFINVTCSIPEQCKGLNREESFKPYKIESLHIRQGYVGDSCVDRESYNDIAVFELAEPVEFSRNIFPICLPSEPKVPPIGSTGYKLFGYGRDPSDKALEIGKLKALKSHVTACTDEILYEGVFCTTADNSGLSCDGDSGSGVVRTSDTRNVEELVGVLSAGVPCPELYDTHNTQRKYGRKLTLETDLLVDVSAHLEFFCNCCGICNESH